MKLDNTMVEKFNVCPREFYWRHIRKLERGGTTSIHLVFGSAIHEALEILYKGSTLAEAQSIFLDTLGEAEDSKGKKTPECGLKDIGGLCKGVLP